MLHLILDIENKIISFGVYGRIQNFQIIGTFLFRCVIAGGMCLNVLLLVFATDIFTQPRKTTNYFSILFRHEAWLVASSLFLWFSERRLFTFIQTFFNVAMFCKSCQIFFTSAINVKEVIFLTTEQHISDLYIFTFYFHHVHALMLSLGL